MKVGETLVKDGGTGIKEGIEKRFESCGQGQVVEELLRTGCAISVQLDPFVIFGVLLGEGCVL